MNYREPMRRFGLALGAAGVLASSVIVPGVLATGGAGQTGIVTADTVAVGQTVAWADIVAAFPVAELMDEVESDEDVLPSLVTDEDDDEQGEDDADVEDDQGEDNDDQGEDEDAAPEAKPAKHHHHDSTAQDEDEDDDESEDDDDGDEDEVDDDDSGDDGESDDD